MLFVFFTILWKILNNCISEKSFTLDSTINILLYILYHISPSIHYTILPSPCFFNAFQNKLQWEVYTLPHLSLYIISYNSTFMVLFVLRKNLHTVKCTNLKCTIWWVLADVYTCVTPNQMFCIKMQNIISILKILLPLPSASLSPYPLKQNRCSDFWF